MLTNLSAWLQREAQRWVKWGERRGSHISPILDLSFGLGRNFHKAQTTHPAGSALALALAFPQLEPISCRPSCPVPRDGTILGVGWEGDAFYRAKL